MDGTSKGKVHGFYTFGFLVSWCAAKSSLGSKVNSQLESSKIQDQKTCLHQLRVDAGLLLIFGVRIELPSSGIKIIGTRILHSSDE